MESSSNDELQEEIDDDGDDVDDDDDDSNNDNDGKDDADDNNGRMTILDFNFIFLPISLQIYFFNFSHEKLPTRTYGFIFEIRMGINKQLGDIR